jgi:hypothetical protein
MRIIVQLSKLFIGSYFKIYAGNSVIPNTSISLFYHKQRTCIHNYLLRLTYYFTLCFYTSNHLLNYFLWYLHYE